MSTAVHAAEACAAAPPTLPLFAYRRRNDAEGTFLSAGEGAEAVTGWSGAALASGAAGYWALAPPERLAELAAEIAAALRSRRDFGLVYRLQRRYGGSSLVVDRGASREGGVIEGWICQLSGILAADRALQESDRLRAIGKLTNDVVTEIDAEGRLLDVSPNVERVFGRRPEQVIGRSGIAGLRPEDREMVWQALRRLAPGSPPRFFNARLADRHGGAFWIEGSVAAFHSIDGSERYAAVVRDVSEREERSRALAESEAKFATAFHSSPVGMALSSLDGDELIEANASFWRLLDMPDPTPGREQRMHAIWGGDARRAPALARISRDGELRARVRFQVPSGEVREVLVAARTISLRGRSAILWHFLDATDEQRAQRALREKDLLYRSLVESCPLGIVTTAPTGRITMANAAFLRMLGAPAGESLVGRQARDLGGAAFEAAAAELRHMLESKGRGEFEFEYESPWARRMRIRCHGASLADADGAPVGALTLVEDVTERRRLEDELRRSQKMEALGQLAAGASHELQNWLLVIDACSQELEASLSDRPRVAALEKIRRATAGATGLAQQLMRFGRLTRLCPRALDLNEAITRGHGMWRHLVPSNVQVDFALDADVPPVLVDPAGLDQMVLNLVINARDAMPEGGTITISTHRDAACRSWPMPPGAARERFVVVSVCDTGPGIPEGVRRRIFEPFFTTKGAGAGNGLGLAMVDAIVTESGGQVRVGEPGPRGARFDVYLPTAPEGVGPPPA